MWLGPPCPSMCICGLKPKARTAHIPVLKAGSAEAKIPPKKSLRQGEQQQMQPKNRHTRKTSLAHPALTQEWQQNKLAEQLGLKGNYTKMTMPFGQFNFKNNVASLLIKVFLAISLQFKANR